MYYPFFKARQFELIALRELVVEGSISNVVTPILEPVKDSQNNLNLAYKIFRDGGFSAYFVVNSKNGQLKGDNELFLNYLSNLDGKTFKVAFQYNENHIFIDECIKKFGLSDCMLVCTNDIDSDNIGFKSIAENPCISTFTLEDPGKNRSLQRYLRKLEKSIVRLDDCFEKQVRNSDFLDVKEHRFSEEHLWYKDDGFTGFSDYTALPSEFVEGGSTPRAVVIHWTFLKPNDEIWIRHFTSISNDSIANVQGKFGEAASKAVKFITENDINNSASNELITYYRDGHYPGLGMVKKISIKNHLIIISEYLKRPHLI
jgi:hypothetical protein